MSTYFSHRYIGFKVWKSAKRIITFWGLRIHLSICKQSKKLWEMTFNKKKIMILSGISCDFGEESLQISYLTSHSVHGYTSLLLIRYMMSSFAFCMNMCLYKPILLNDVTFEHFLSKWTVPSIDIGKVMWERGHALGKGPGDLSSRPV